MEEIYERTKSYRDHSGRKRTLGKGTRNAENLRTCKGCANLENICYDIKDLGVKYLTVYAFSTENWKRSREEVEALMKLFRSYLKKCIKISKKNNMRMKVIGYYCFCTGYPAECPGT